MTGSQSFQATPDNGAKSLIEAAPRKLVTTSKFNEMVQEGNNNSSVRKKHTNTSGLIVSLIGGGIVAYIIYTLIANYL